MKFSLIVPVYNVEQYVKKCLETIHNQTYKNYEVIIVNDGSPDNSESIIKDYIKDKDNFHLYSKENGGLSDARNYGAKKVTGDYMIFIDSDDYIEPELLEKLNDEIKENNPEIIRYNYNFVENQKIKMFNKSEFHSISADEAIPILVKEGCMEQVWAFCYKSSFWEEQKFEFSVGRVHEDLGLCPIVLMNSKKISNLNYVGYNYVIRPGSIMTSKDEEKMIKKFDDSVYFYETCCELIDNSSSISNITKKILKSYYANCVYNKGSLLSLESQKYALKVIKEKKVYKNLMNDSIKRKIKKIIIKYIPAYYLKKIKIKT